MGLHDIGRHLKKFLILSWVEKVIPRDRNSFII
jgi:hypothetical protein